MMRKTILLLCAATLLLLAAGCAGKAASDGSESAYNEVDEVDQILESGDYIVVGYSQIGSESDWRLANTASFKEVFTEENDFYLIYEDAQQKQENQLKVVRQFILQGVDYIVLDPIVETGWDSVLQEAKDEGICVIISDRQVDIENDDLYTCWVGSDFHEEGVTAGNWLAEYLEETDRSEEEIHIVTLQGTLGSSAQIGRTEGFAEVMQQQDNWQMLAIESADFTQAKGKEVMAQFLDMYDGIDVVVCENDNMAFGAIDAIQEAGLTCGPDGDIIIISFDATKAALEAMIDGEINLDVECNPLLGQKVADIIKQLENGEEVEKIQYVEESYFDTTMDLEEIIKERAY